MHFAQLKNECETRKVSIKDSVPTPLSGKLPPNNPPQAVVKLVIC